MGIDFFMSRVKHEDGCWIWTGGTGGKGEHMYGIYQGSTAHRWSYEHFVGPIPEGKVLDHYVCDVKLCVNPEHVQPVTQRENLHRSEKTVNSINTAKTHCDNGHEFTKENTRVTKRQRVCRACKRDWARNNRKR